MTDAAEYMRLPSCRIRQMIRETVEALGSPTTNVAVTAPPTGRGMTSITPVDTIRSDMKMAGPQAHSLWT